LSMVTTPTTKPTRIYKYFKQCSQPETYIRLIGGDEPKSFACQHTRTTVVLVKDLQMYLRKQESFESTYTVQGAVLRPKKKAEQT
jgi:hypothetical protein